MALERLALHPMPEIEGWWKDVYRLPLDGLHPKFNFNPKGKTMPQITLSTAENGFTLNTKYLEGPNNDKFFVFNKFDDAAAKAAELLKATPPSSVERIKTGTRFDDMPVNELLRQAANLDDLYVNTRIAHEETTRHLKVAEHNQSIFAEENNILHRRLAEHEEAARQRAEAAAKRRTARSKKK